MKREHKTGPTHGDLDGTPVRYSMTEGVVTLSPLATVAEIAETMASEGIHAVVIARPLGAGEDPRGSWGVVSDLDLVTAGGQPGATAAELAASPTLSVSPDDSLARAAELMREHRTSHVLVVGYDGVPLGVVSTLDIARVLARRPAVASERSGA